MIFIRKYIYFLLHLVTFTFILLSLGCGTDETSNVEKNFTKQELFKLSTSRNTRVIIVDYHYSVVLSSEIAVLKSDYESEGFNVRIIKVPYYKRFSDKTAFSWIRAKLLETDNIQGAILIGNIPTGFFEDHLGRLYPSDIVYQYPKAILVDEDGNQLYEELTGDTRYSIPVGRVTALNTGAYYSPASVEQVRNYLNRLHDYRNGDMELPALRSLNFVDSPLGFGANIVSNHLRSLYGSYRVKTVIDAAPGEVNNITTVDLYKQLIKNLNGYEFVYLHSLGDPGAHMFYSVTEDSYSLVEQEFLSSQDYRTLHKTNVNFYIMNNYNRGISCNYVDNTGSYPKVATEFACGSALFAQTDNEPVKTLGVIAQSAIVPSYANFNSEKFFKALKVGAGIGMALNYQNGVGAYPYFQLFGDPWLTSRASGNGSVLKKKVYLYWGFGYIAEYVQELLSDFGLSSLKHDKKDVFYWNISDTAERLVDYWQLKIDKAPRNRRRYPSEYHNVPHSNISSIYSSGIWVSPPS